MGRDVVEKILKETNAHLDCLRERRYAEGEIDELHIVHVSLWHNHTIWSDKYEVMVSIYLNNKGKIIPLSGIGGVEIKKFSRRQKEKANRYFDELVKKYKLKEKRGYKHGR